MIKKNKQTLKDYERHRKASTATRVKLDSDEEEEETHQKGKPKVHKKEKRQKKMQALFKLQLPELQAVLEEEKRKIKALDVDVLAEQGWRINLVGLKAVWPEHYDPKSIDLSHR